MPFVFNDTETTGTEAAFDQTPQIAAKRTDDLSNELERFEIRCRIATYIAPSSGALNVNRISAERLSAADTAQLVSSQAGGAESA
jgi:exodeoxyribonuclease-1